MTHPTERELLPKYKEGDKVILTLSKDAASELNDDSNLACLVIHKDAVCATPQPAVPMPDAVGTDKAIEKAMKQIWADIRLVKGWKDNQVVVECFIPSLETYLRQLLSTQPAANSHAGGEMRSADPTDKIYDALQSYRCLHTSSIVGDEPNGGMPLADLLTPEGEETIALGDEELGELAAHISDAIASAQSPLVKK